MRNSVHKHTAVQQHTADASMWLYTKGFNSKKTLNRK